jgi:hypothetical protein
VCLAMSADIFGHQNRVAGCGGTSL